MVYGRALVARPSVRPSSPSRSAVLRAVSAGLCLHTGGRLRPQWLDPSGGRPGEHAGQPARGVHARHRRGAGGGGGAAAGDGGGEGGGRRDGRRGADPPHTPIHRHHHKTATTATTNNTNATSRPSLQPPLLNHHSHHQSPLSPPPPSPPPPSPTSKRWRRRVWRQARVGRGVLDPRSQPNCVTDQPLLPSDVGPA